jgi:hypothetical protein
VPHSKASRAQCDNPTRILTVGEIRPAAANSAAVIDWLVTGARMDCT